MTRQTGNIDKINVEDELDNNDGLRSEPYQNYQIEASGDDRIQRNQPIYNKSRTSNMEKTLRTLVKSFRHFTHEIVQQIKNEVN